MINLQQLYLYGFRSVGELRMNLDSPGLCLVEGLNLDNDTALSNGAGKSTPFSGIKWVVTGKTGSGTPTDEIPNTFLKKGCTGVLTWENNGVAHLVQRSLKFTPPQKACPHCGFVRGTRKAQCPECGVDWSSATCLNIYTRSVDDKKFEVKTAHRKDDTQKEIFRWLGLDEQSFNAIVLISQGFSDRFSSYKDAERNRFMEKFIDTEYLVIGEGRAKEKFKELQTKVTSIEGQKNASQENISNLVALMREALEKEKERKSEIASMLEQENSKLEDLREEIAETEQAITEVTKTYQDIVAKHNDATVAYESVRQDVQAKYGVLTSAQSEVQRLEGKLRNINQLGTGECDKCGSAITPDTIDAYKSRVTASVEAAQQAVAPAQADYDKANEVLQKHMNNVGQLQNTSTQKQSELHSYQTTLSNYQSLLQQCERRIDELTTEQNKKSETDSLNRSMLDAKSKFNDLLTMEKEVTELLDYYNYWVTGFSVRGIRSYLIDNLLTTVNKQLIHYCSRLFDNTVTVQLLPEKELKSGGSKNSVVLSVCSEAGGGYSSLSGGEARKVDVAVQLALRDAAEVVAGFQSNIFVADEILDNLDEAAAERVIDILKEFGKTRTVYLISHDPSIKSMVDRTILMKKVEGITALVDAT